MEWKLVCETNLKAKVNMRFFNNLKVSKNAVLDDDIFHYFWCKQKPDTFHQMDNDSDECTVFLAPQGAQKLQSIHNIWGWSAKEGGYFVQLVASKESKSGFKENNHMLKDWSTLSCD